MPISFAGYYQAQLKGKRNFPQEPYYICPLGDKTMLRAIPKIFKKDMKDEIVISYKKDKDDEKLVFKFSPKAYGKIIQTIFKGQEFPVSDGRLKYFSHNLKFLKPNSKITSVIYELPKNHFAELKDPSDGVAVMIGRNTKRILTKFEKSVKNFDKNTSEYFDNVQSDHEKFYRYMQNAVDNMSPSFNSNFSDSTNRDADVGGEISYDEVQSMISNFNEKHPCLSKLLYKLIVRV